MKANVHVPSLMNAVTMNVTLTGVREWRIRLWLGVKLITLAARVIGCGIVVDQALTPRDAA